MENCADERFNGKFCDERIALADLVRKLEPRLSSFVLRL
jgi:hypothetical protein